MTNVTGVKPTRTSADGAGADHALPVIAAPRPTKVRASRTSRWRAGVLIAIHVLIVVHVIHWLVVGKTLSPVEPSESMYTLNDGYLNAGFILFTLAIAATAIFGRFFCGWGCHLIAYQDLCTTLLKRIGIKPKPLRARLLLLAPLALAIYMFVWPSAYRLVVGAPRPPMTNHLLTTGFWDTFPGPAIAILTFALCGFAIVYVLGAKGFCTYACPYGGFFALADQVAPGRIIVTDACEHCGHCTATCTSNVRVHEEVALYGMVVDPGCMKCMDCVSVCPNDALYFGFKKPSVGAKPSSPRRPVAYDFFLWEEMVMAVVGVVALLTYRGLYNQIPLLLAMGMAAMTAYLVMKLVRLIHDPHVRFQQLQLKRGGRLTRGGVGFVFGMVVWLAFSSHSAAIQFASWRGRSMVESLALGDEVWESNRDWWTGADEADRNRVDRAIAELEWVDVNGLMATPIALHKLVWAYLARGDDDKAEGALRRLADATPEQAEPHRGLAWVMRKRGRIDEAIQEYRKTLDLDSSNQIARTELAALLIEHRRFDEADVVLRDGLETSPGDVRSALTLGQLLMRQGRPDEAVGVLETAVASSPKSAALHTTLGMALVQTKRTDEGIASLHRAVELSPDSGEIQYDLGYALLSINRTEEALPYLQQAVESHPNVALWQYNLAVATFMRGAPADALPHIREATRLDPNDPQAWGFLAVVLEALGDQTGAIDARTAAQELGAR